MCLWHITNLKKKVVIVLVDAVRLESLTTNVCFLFSLVILMHGCHKSGITQVREL